MGKRKLLSKSLPKKRKQHEKLTKSHSLPEVEEDDTHNAATLEDNDLIGSMFDSVF